MFGRLWSRSGRSEGEGPARRGGGSTVAEAPGPVPDDLPRDAFFAAPLRVSRLVTKVEDHEGGVRASFAATVKDAERKRCPDIAVHARIQGPHRDATGMGHTSMMGTVTFRMSGPPGDYRCDIEDVAGGALGLDESASTLHAVVEARPTTP